MTRPGPVLAVQILIHPGLGRGRGASGVHRPGPSCAPAAYALYASAVRQRRTAARASVPGRAAAAGQSAAGSLPVLRRAQAAAGLALALARDAPPGTRHGRVPPVTVP